MVLHLLTEWEMVVMDYIDDYYLPTDSLKQVLIAVIFVDEEGNYSEMMRTIVTQMRASGMHSDAVSWGYSEGCGMIAIYKKIPMLDIWGHLHSC